MNLFVATSFHNLKDVTVVIPVHNQLPYTRQCLESLNACGCPDEMILVVDNASSDGTADFLAKRSGLRVITNAENRACAAAWNQGYHASMTAWTVFLNNDVMVTDGWLNALLEHAEAEGLDIICPALGEGALDYDLAEYGRDYVARMAKVQRSQHGHGVAFAVRRDVLQKLGDFDENFRKGGHEDEDFFRRARATGFKTAVSGCAYIHHFGSVTQNYLRAVKGDWRGENQEYYRRKWQIKWAERRWAWLRRKLKHGWWRWHERWQHGHTLCEIRAGGEIIYR